MKMFFLKIINKINSTAPVKYVIELCLITALISFLIPFSTDLFNFVIDSNHKFDLRNLYYTPGIFANILPIILVTKKNLLIKDGAAKAIILIFYYIIFLPVFNHGFNNILFIPENTFILKMVALINIIFLILCHVVLFRYSFTDIIKGKRKIKVRDIVTTFSVYITLAMSFGFIYLMIGILSKEPVLYGIDYSKRDLYFYFKHIYFSFITITSVGYGDMYPISFLTQLVVIIEIISGIALLNFTLGITLSSGILNFSAGAEEKNSGRSEGVDEIVGKTMRKTFNSVKKISSLRKRKD